MSKLIPNRSGSSNVNNVTSRKSKYPALMTLIQLPIESIIFMINILLLVILAAQLYIGLFLVLLYYKGTCTHATSFQRAL